MVGELLFCQLDKVLNYSEFRLSYNSLPKVEDYAAVKRNCMKGETDNAEDPAHQNDGVAWGQD